MEILEAVAQATQLGVTIGLTTVATSLGGLFLGLWVDGKLGTRPWGALLLTLVGVLAGSVSTYRLALSIVARAQPVVPEEVEQPPVLTLKDVQRTLGLAALVWFILAGSVLLGLLVGWWLDTQLGIRPCLTVILMAVGLGGGSAGVYLLTRSKEESEEDA
jgi:F0F1-type ATP synthase assembly protein I